MTYRLEWLEDTCLQAEEQRPPLRTPYLVELDGAQWTIGSDGHAMIGFREVRTDKTYPPVPALNWRDVLELRHVGVDAYPIDLAALRDFAEECVPPPTKECSVCGGAGVVPCSVCAGVIDKDDDDECDFCVKGTEQCENCMEGPRFMPIWLGACRVQRAVLWKWLTWITDEQATLWEPPDPKKPRVFTGDDWFLMVMPLGTADGQHEDDPRFPWPPA